MKGYLHSPDETAMALREWRGKTWMYSGDVGFMDQEGYVFLCDRAKDMLIVGGYKVFSVEVEDKVSKHEFVANAALVGTPDPARPGNDIVHLHVTLTKEGLNLQPAELQASIIEFCRQNMAPYKVPKVVHIEPELPLTSVGKIDKKVLRQRIARENFLHDAISGE